MVITQGYLLGGRIRYSQPAHGFRSGIEPVLLAASVACHPNELILEAGTGAGAALLCLSARIPGIRAVGVERDAPTASLAATNAQANGLENIEIITGDIEATTFEGHFDHAIANPPYHSPSGSASPVPARETAKRGSNRVMQTWISQLGAALRDRGSLTLIVPAGMIPACLLAMDQTRCPCTVVFPLWPKFGRPAKLVLLRGVKTGRTPMRLMPGLILHQADGSFTERAQSLLTGGAALNLDHADDA